MPSWWKDKKVYHFMMVLDETLETVGPLDEFHGLLAAWELELARLREVYGSVGRVEIEESHD